MSDDGYYAGSPYDDFDEILWDADPGPDLADDLAQHSAHSPVWQDDPVGELEVYHSDWDYYSDDYYDDDPAILRKNPADGSPLRTKNAGGIPTQKRGKKRKHDEATRTIDTQESRSLANSIQGTVWAKATSPNPKIFRDGQEEKVALLSDWKERFKLDDGTLRTFGQGQLARDESWANDLSLADMGLTHARELVGTQSDTNHQDNSMEEEEDDDDAEYDRGNNESDPGRRALLMSEQSDTEVLEHIRPNQDQPQTRSKTGRASHEYASKRKAMEGSDETSLASSRKRHKVANLPTPPQTQDTEATTAEDDLSSPMKATAEVDGTAAQQVQDTSTRRHRVTSQGRSVQQTSQESAQNAQPRKRKLSVSADEIQSAQGSTTSSRAKRVASRKLRQEQDFESTTSQTSGPNTRSTRARKKQK